MGLGRVIQGYGKTWDLEGEGGIGTEQKGVLNDQGNNLKKTFAKQLDVSIIQRRRWN